MFVNGTPHSTPKVQSSLSFPEFDPEPWYAFLILPRTGNRSFKRAFSVAEAVAVAEEAVSAATEDCLAVPGPGPGPSMLMLGIAASNILLSSRFLPGFWPNPPSSAVSRLVSSSIKSPILSTAAPLSLFAPAIFLTHPSMAPPTSPRPEPFEFDRVLRIESELTRGVPRGVGLRLKPVRGISSGGSRSGR